MGRCGSDYRRLVSMARKQGWTVKATKAGYMLRSPDGAFQATVHLTDGDIRGFRNTLARVRAHGLRYSR